MSSSHLWLPYCQMLTAPPSAVAARTDGVRIYLDDGRELIDGTSSWWTACHGYNHPHILEAVGEQLREMPHVMLGGLVHEPVVRLAERLSERMPGELNRFFFSESGSVSVEVAMKMAIQFWRNQGIAERTRFVSFKDGYHGDTFAAMSVCDPEDGMHHLFKGVLAEQLILDLPRDDETSDSFARAVERHADELAGIVLEPLVQAAAGMRFHEPHVLERIEEVARANDLLLIVDEIATGFGRTGTLFASEQAGIEPDILTISKALTGGVLPLAATAATSRIFDAFLSDDFESALMHGPTYAGNPLGCAAANASLDLFEREPRLAQVAAIESQMREGLAGCTDAEGVADVRVKGAIGVVQYTPPLDVNALRQRFLEEGVWIRPFRDIVYIAPPLVIGSDDLGRLIDAVNRVVMGAGARARRA